MECKECGTNIDREAHDRGICFDCYCQMDLRSYEEHQKKNDTHNSEEEQACILPTPSHLGEFVITAGRLTAVVVTFELLWGYLDYSFNI